MKTCGPRKRGHVVTIRAGIPKEVLHEASTMNEHLKLILNTWRQFRAEQQRLFFFVDAWAHMAVNSPAKK